MSNRPFFEGDPCGICSGVISRRGGHLQCNNCGWLAPENRIATTEAVASVTRIPAPDVADKGAASTHLRDLDQPLLHGMESTAASTRARPGEGSSPAGRGSELLASNLQLSRLAGDIEYCLSQLNPEHKVHKILTDVMHVLRTAGETPVARTDHAENLAKALEHYLNAHDTCDSVMGADLATGMNDANEGGFVDKANDAWRAMRLCLYEYRKHFPVKTNDRRCEPSPTGEHVTKIGGKCVYCGVQA